MNTEKVVEHIVSWLDVKLMQAKCNGFVIGVSGGVDSAVVSTLCAMTGNETIVVVMPIHQKPDQTDRGTNHVEWLKEKYSNVASAHTDLSTVFDAFQGVMELPSDTLGMINSKSRLRMVTLYAFANENRCLVAGTGNKVEDYGLGFFTKYGDGGVDLSPIADLLKSEVYEIAKYLGINQEIIDAPPTDGLWENSRTDEEQIGATYDELEWAMAYIDANEDKPITERQGKVLNIYNKFHKNNAHKMAPIPICEIPDEIK